ncbi:MAG: nitronate monooxygenase [Dermatophilaceae bacterium]
MSTDEQTAHSSRLAEARPPIIQGGMGVGVSGWSLARAVSMRGQLGVVSGTAIDVVVARRLQAGDPGGDVRRALSRFPVPAIAAWILDAYFVEGGIAPDALYRPVPRHTLSSTSRLVELTVAAAFTEVFLAKEGHDGLVGINVLRKIELPMPATLYGAILAGVDVVLCGAGSPAEIPALVRGLARHEDVAIDVRVMGARSSDGFGRMPFSPGDVVPDPGPVLPSPAVLAVVASTDLATGLATGGATRPDGFVIEGEVAGGHNAPPRGPRRVDDLGQPVYDDRDVVDLDAVLALGLPVWLAGGYGTPERLAEARALGAAGVQVGTAFAFCDESGFAPDIKALVRSKAVDGSLQVRSDWRASPTGFPFRVADLDGTVSDARVAQARPSVCDLGVLRTAYLTDSGTVDFRCPAEPERAYLRKGGREVNREGRVCLCNALLASAGLGQRRPGGAVEPALVTAGSDLAAVVALGSRRSDGSYTAGEVVDYLLTG